MTALYGYTLSAPRRGERLSGAALESACLSSDLAWAHLSAEPEDVADAQTWLARVLPELDPSTVQALTGAGTRPRSVHVGQGAMILLRDVPDETIEDGGDMPSLRLYVDARMVISLSRRPVGALTVQSERIASGTGAVTTGAFLHDLVEIIAERIDTTVDILTRATDTLEDALDDGRPTKDERQEATRLRRAVLGLRRHVSPQRDALEALRLLDLVPKGERRRLAELHDRHVRAVEELDLLIQRLVLAREGIAGAQAERLNRQLYILSIVSVLFLPLGFLTGLMGVNLGGIPGAGSPVAFWIFVGLLAGVFGGLGLILWRMRWL